MKRRAAVLALAALALAGCAALAVVKAPQVSLAGLGIESLGLFEQRFVLHLRVRNPNPVDIPVEGLRFDLEVAGLPFATGVSKQRVTLPALGEVVIDVSGSSDLVTFMQRFGDQPPAGEGLDYRLQGEVQVAGRGAIPFDHRGEVALPALPGGGRRRERETPRETPQEAPRALPGAI